MLPVLHVLLDAHEDNNVDGNLISGDLGTIIAVVFLVFLCCGIIWFIGNSRGRW